jgi:plasmid stabilization system protein ParE
VACQIFYTEDALVDLEIILEYIRADNAPAAERLGTALLAHVDLRGISLDSAPPFSAVKEFEGSCTLRSLYYRLHDDKSVVEILHFWHGSRREPDF